MRRFYLALAASFCLVGCVGSLEPEYGFDGDGSGSSKARTMFEQTVYPIIRSPGAQSDCSTCHDSKAPSGNVTGFVSASATDAYTTITSFQSVVGNFSTSEAGLLGRMASTDVHVTTRGRVFTADQTQKINAWLAQEVLERTGMPPSDPSAQATARLLNQWTACMTLANWQAANMTTAWGNMQTDDGDTCANCHATGGQGMIVSDLESGTSPPGMWTTVSTHKSYLIQFFSVDLAAQKVVINMKSFQGVATGTAPHVEHPTFDPANNDGMTALTTFYNTTMSGLAGCNASGTKLNPPAM